MRKLNRIIIFAGFMMALTSCSDKLEPGPDTVENRNVSDFDQLEIRTSYNIELRSGMVNDIEIHAPANLVPYIETRVVEGKLVIRELANRIGDVDRVTISVSSQGLRSLELAGSGRVYGDAMDGAVIEVLLNGSGNIDLPVNAENLKASIGGSGNIDLYGEAQTVELGVDGSGSINTSSIFAEDGIASIDGSGTIELYSSLSIYGRVSGSGLIRVHGNPNERDIRITGSGQVLIIN